MTGLEKKLSREKLESECCGMISDSAKSPAKEELAGWKKGTKVQQEVHIQICSQRYIKVYEMRII